MDKPITVARQELMESIVELVNNSNLPAFVIIDIFESITPALRSQAERQYQTDLKKWKEENDGE